MLLIGPRLDFLDPYWGFILRAYWLRLTIHVGIALITSIVSFYWLARVAGLADLGRRGDLVERDIRRGGLGTRIFRRLYSEAMKRNILTDSLTR